MSILGLSQVLMYESHYDYIEIKFSDNSRLLFTGTDEIKTEDIYEDFSEDKEIFGFINYSANSKYYGNSSKLLVSKMKDETGCVAFKVFLGLKPKMYSFMNLCIHVDDSGERKKSK